MSRFHKCEVYDLEEITRREMQIIVDGVHAIYELAINGRGPFTVDEVCALNSELRHCLEGK